MDTAEVLEFSKENIKPLARGRKSSMLGTALHAETDDNVRHNLLKKRDEYEIQLRSYDGDDPLHIWFEYIEWVEQNFPKNGREGNIQLLLERCLAEFKDVEKYNQDVRYVSIWIRYLNQVADPLEMYKQVHAHGIGTQCARFYENWAESFERTGDHKRADKVYLEGLQRRAEPIDELKVAHDRFLLRVARRILDEGPKSPDQSASDERSAMSILKAHGRKNVVNNVRTGNSIQRATPGVLLPLNANFRERNENALSKPGNKVFNDENTDFNDVVSDHVIKTAGPISRKDPILKENLKKPGRWNEGKFKSSVPVPAHSHPSFPVHVDENTDIPNRGVNLVVNALKPRRFDDELSIPVALFEPPDPKKRPMYPKHKVYSGGTEFSLEELRAIKYNKEYEEKKLQQEQLSKQEESMQMSLLEMPQQQEDKNSNSTIVSVDKIQVYRSVVKDPASHEMLKEELMVYAQHSESHELVRNTSTHNQKRSDMPDHSIEKGTGTYVFSDPPEEPESQNQMVPDTKPPFTLYVDDDDKMNAIDSLVKNSRSEKQKKMGKSIIPIAPVGLEFLTSDLKVQKRQLRIPEIEPSEPTEGCESSETSTNSACNSRIEQSFTVNTKEAMNAVHGLWKSPQFENYSFVQLPPQQAKPTFTIHMDDSSVQERCLTAAKCKPDNESTVNQKIMVPGSGARQSLSFKKPGEPCWQKSREKASENQGRDNVESEIVPDKHTSEGSSSGKASKEVLKLPSLPFIPSPGRTLKELDEMGPEGKENSTSVDPKPPRSCTRDMARLLQPSKHIPFQPANEQWQQEEEDDDDDLGVGPLYPQMSDETCTTQAFAMPLLSSTPFCKNPTEMEMRKTEMLDADYLDGCYDAAASASTACHNSSMELKRTNRTRLHQSAPGLTVGTSLSIIMENSKEFKSSSSSGSVKGSTKRTTSHWSTFENIDPVMECSQESKEEAAVNLSHLENKMQNSCIAYPFPKTILAAMLNSAGFLEQKPQEGFIKISGLLPALQRRVTLGNDEYLFSELPLHYNGKILEATEVKSGRIVSLKVTKSICPWEAYILEELQTRLSNSTIALYYMSIEKAYFYTKASVLLSEHSQYGSLCDMENYLGNKAETYMTPTIGTYWTYEMLDMIKHLQKCRIIHGQFSYENLYLHNIPVEMNGKPSLKLKNFDQAIDMTLFQPGTKFNISEASGTENKLFERPCSYEIDLYKMASTVHHLLYSGRRMEVEKKNGKWFCRLPNYGENFWTNLFNELLNNKMPDFASLHKTIIQHSNEASLFHDFKKLRDVLSPMSDRVQL